MMSLCKSGDGITEETGYNPVAKFMVGNMFYNIRCCVHLCIFVLQKILATCKIPGVEGGI